jgi:hypothetical protein
MPDRKQRIYSVFFDEIDWPLLEKIEEARQLKGMTKKGFFLYGIANLVPEIAPEIIQSLTKKPYSKNTSAVVADVAEATKEDDDVIDRN